MITAFLIVGLVAIMLVGLSRSHRLMVLITIGNFLAFAIMAGMSFSKLNLPAYYLESRFFFIDFLSLAASIACCLIFFLSALYSEGYVRSLIKSGEMNRRNLKAFYIAFNSLFLVSVLAFFSNNLAMFWVFVELSTAFSALLIVFLNTKENIVAALKYIFICSSAMLFSFIGLILLFAISQHTLGQGTLNIDELMQAAGHFPVQIFIISFIFIFIGFAAKAGIVPFHGWMPHAYSKAPSPISAIMSGVVSFVGLYGILRVSAIAMKTDAFPKISMFLMLFGLLSIGVAAITMISKKNIKKLIGYTSVESAGLVLVLIAIGTPIAMFWAVYYLIFQAITKSLLFLSAGIIHLQFGSIHLGEIKNPLSHQKLASVGLFVGSASIAGFPLLPLFLPKMLAMMELGKMSAPLLFVLLVLLLISASAIALFMIRLFSPGAGKDDGKNPGQLFRVPLTMQIPIIMLIIALIAFGTFFPDFMESLITRVLADLGILQGI